MEETQKPKGNSGAQLLIELMTQGWNRKKTPAEVYFEQIHKLIDVKPKARRPIEAICNYKNCKEQATENGLDTLFSEVALIQNAFGWSEHEILSLPNIRRKSYVSLLLKSGGNTE